MRHIFYRSFGTQNLMVTFIFKFEPRKGQLQVKLGQIRSNFKIQHFTTKICLSCAVLPKLSGLKKIILYVRQMIMPKIIFQQCEVITFTCFFLPLHSQKQRHFFEILYACCLYVFRSHIFHFLIT